MKTQFVFMIKNGLLVKSVRLIKTQKTLDKYSKLYPLHEIKAFQSEEQALQFIKENNYPIDMAKQKVYMQVHDTKEQIVEGSEVLKQFKKGKIDQESPEFKKIQEDEGLQQFLKQTKNLYKYYTENESLIQKAANKIIKTSQYFLFFDGASKNNPGPSGIGFAIFDNDQKIYQQAIHTGFKTNNQAEYLALLYGLKSSLSLGIELLNVYGDSQLIINQMNNLYRVKDRNLILYNGECKQLRTQFKHVNFKYIPREQNQLADSLANKGVSLYKKPSNEQEEQEPKNPESI
ncbi:hypothetical protein ABPG74_004035 [Tetrahymena malaccensis]